MEQVIKNFDNNGFTVKLFDTSDEAKEYLLQNIKDQEVTFGGSMTLVNMGLPEALLNQGNKIYRHDVDGFVNKTPDVYICSANALSKNGEIINIDGRGNRVAATIFGPHTVYMVCGINKLEDNLEKAIYRAKNIAAPLNARRLNRNTPCVKGELKCYNCNSSERICRATVILDKKTNAINKFEIILINENLGY